MLPSEEDLCLATKVLTDHRRFRYSHIMLQYVTQERLAFSFFEYLLLLVIKEGEAPHYTPTWRTFTKVMLWLLFPNIPVAKRSCIRGNWLTNFDLNLGFHFQYQNFRLFRILKVQMFHYAETLDKPKIT